MKHILSTVISIPFLFQLHGQSLTATHAMRFGGPSHEVVWNMVLDAEGNTLICGTFAGTADLDPGSEAHSFTSAGGFDGYVLKLDPSGAFLWALTFGGPTDDGANDLAVDAAGNVYVTGYFTGTADMEPGPGVVPVNSGAFDDMVLAKYDASGALAWAMASNTTNGNAGYALDVAANGDVVVGGVFYGTTDLNGGTATNEFTSVGEGDGYIVKYNTGGVFQWAERCGGPLREEITSIDLDDAGNILYCGDHLGTADIDFGNAIANHTSAGGTDIFLGKLSSNGATQWTAAYGGSGADLAYSVDVSSSGKVTVAGYFSGIVDMDPGSSTVNLTSTSPDDVNGFIQRLSATGAFQWATAFTSSDGSAVYQARSLADEGVLLNGSFLGDLDVDPGSTTTELDAVGDLDGFVVQLEADGSYRNSLQVGGAQRDEVAAVVVTGPGVIRCAGSFIGTLDLNGSSAPASLTASGGQDAFVLDLTEESVGIGEHTKAPLPVLFDPVTRTVIVLHDGACARYRMNDMSGRSVMEGPLNPGRTVLDTSPLPSGAYVISTPLAHGRVVLP